MSSFSRTLALPLVSVAGLTTAALAASGIPNLTAYPNPSGFARSLSSAGFIDTANPFFKSLGSNGRSCATCHDPAAGFSITPPLIRKQFDRTLGLHPLFRTVDGSNSPLANVSTRDAKLAAYSMLLNKGLIRIGKPVPPNAEFELMQADDPYNFASAQELSLFRRPLPATNLRFLSDVMWDGRESQLKPSVADKTVALNLRASLLTQANNATRGHAQTTSNLPAKVLAQIVDFELALHTAQASLTGAGGTEAETARGGPVPLSTQNFFLGINDPLGHNPHGTPFNERAMTLFNAWMNSTNEYRRAVARGQEVFNTKPIQLSGVGGLNTADEPLIVGTCTTCHSAPNVGSQSILAPMDLGLTAASRRTLDLPLYSFRNKNTGATRQTTDPGRALITGKWDDMARFKSPVLRGLAARAPYFHNGFAATLDDVVVFYDTRFNIGFTQQEKEDLILFMKAL